MVHTNKTLNIFWKDGVHPSSIAPETLISMPSESMPRCTEAVLAACDGTKTL